MVDEEKLESEIPIKLPGVFNAVFNEGDKILIVQHNYGDELDLDGDFKHSLPGGGVECNEPFDVAAVRETREETGLETRVISLRAALPYTLSRGVILPCESVILGGELKPEDPNEIKDVRFVSLEEAREMFYKGSKIHRAQYKLILIAYQSLYMGAIQYRWPEI